jgi:hypothetical protein
VLLLYTLTIQLHNIAHKLQGVNNSLDVMAGGLSSPMGAKALKFQLYDDKPVCSVAGSLSPTLQEMVTFQENMSSSMQEQTKLMWIRVLRKNYKFFMDCGQATEAYFCLTKTKKLSQAIKGKLKQRHTNPSMEYFATSTVTLCCFNSTSYEAPRALVAIWASSC